MEKYAIVDNDGEMLLFGFSKEEIKLSKKYPELFKIWINTVSENM